MRHCVDDVVDTDSVCQRCEAFRIVGVIGPFPGVTKVHIVADGHLEPVFVVVNATPARNDAVSLVSHTGIGGTSSGNLPAFLKVKQRVEDGIVVRYIDDLPVWKDL